MTPLEHLERFLSDAGVKVSDAVEIREEQLATAASTSTSSSLRVVVSASAPSSIPAGTLLATIPKNTAVLSARNSVARDALEEEKIGGGLALLLATLVEVALGEKSRFYLYLQSLPPRGEYLPVLWPQNSMKQLLRGTSLSPETVVGDRERVKEDWGEEAAPFAERHAAKLLGLEKKATTAATDNDLLTGPDGPFSLRAFFRAATWAASRAFGVDDDHGQALVPLADAFNHAAKIVKLSSLGGGGGGDKGSGGRGGGFEVESACLEEEEESSESESEEEEEKEEEEEEEGEEQQEQKVVAPLRSDGLALDIAICGCDDASEDSLAIYAASEQKVEEGEEEDKEEEEEKETKTKKADGSGGGILGRREKKTRKTSRASSSSRPRLREIFNCYGELGNRELLSKYGFCLPAGENPFDAVPLRPALLLSSLFDGEEAAAAAAAVATKTSKARANAKARAAARRRARWLRDNSDLLDDDDGDDLTVSAGGGGGAGGGEDGDDERKNKRRKSSGGGGPEGRGGRPRPLVAPTLSPSLRATLTVICASQEEADSWGDGDGDGLRVALAPRWWRREREGGEGGGKGEEKGKKNKKRKRPPMLGPLPLTAGALREADPPLPFPLGLEVLSSSLEKRIEEFGPEPDYEGVLSSWGETDSGSGDEGEEKRARAERAVRASALLRRGELSLLRQTLKAARSLLSWKK